MAFMDDLQGWIQGAAQQFGVSSSYLNTTAKIESNNNPNAPGGGLFQFRGPAATDVGLSNPYDPRGSTYAAAAYAANNTAALTNALGRAPQDWEVYLAHQQGASGAAKILNNPGAYATDAVGNFMGNINAPEFKALTGLDVNNPFRAITAGDFADYWKKKYQNTSGVTDPAGSILPNVGGNPLTSVAGEAAKLSGEVNPNAVSSGASTGWFAWLEHQGVRGATIATGFVFLGAGLSIFALGAIFRSNAGSVIAGSAIGGAVAGRFARAPAAPPAPDATPLTPVVEKPALATPPVIDVEGDVIPAPRQYAELPASSDGFETGRFNLLKQTNKGFAEYVAGKPSGTDEEKAALHRGFFPNAATYKTEAQSNFAIAHNKDGPTSSLTRVINGKAVPVISASDGFASLGAISRKVADAISAPSSTGKKKLPKVGKAATSPPVRINTAEGFTVGDTVQLKDPKGKGRTSEPFEVLELWHDQKKGFGAKLKGEHSGEGFFPVSEFEKAMAAPVLKTIRPGVREKLLKLGVIRDWTKPKPKK